MGGRQQAFFDPRAFFSPLALADVSELLRFIPQFLPMVT